MSVQSFQFCPTLWGPMDCSPPDSSVHGTSQERTLEWVAMPSSRGSSQPTDWTASFMSPALAGRFFTTRATRKSPASTLRSLQFGHSVVSESLWHHDCSTPGFPVHHQLLKLAQTHVHRESDAIRPSHPLSSPFPSAFNLSQHQGLFQWVSYLQQFWMEF